MAGLVEGVVGRWAWSTLSWDKDDFFPSSMQREGRSRISSNAWAFAGFHCWLALKPRGQCLPWVPDSRG